MTLVIKNVKAEFLPAFKGLAKGANAKCEIEKPKKLSKFAKGILKAAAQVEQERKNGTLRVFTNVDEMVETILLKK